MRGKDRIINEEKKKEKKRKKKVQNTVCIKKKIKRK
jgi:hypothetical protein